MSDKLQFVVRSFASKFDFGVKKLRVGSYLSGSFLLSRKLRTMHEIIQINTNKNALELDPSFEVKRVVRLTN